jgi:GNAT superfamily N-acetyltransferase
MAEGPTVIGYCTLSAYTVHPGELPEHLIRKLPWYPILPATLIGRLAVDERYRRKGYGEEFLIDALKRILAATSAVGSIDVIVDAENENAIEFYRSYGFLPFPDRPNKLFLAMQTVQALFQ